MVKVTAAKNKGRLDFIEIVVGEDNVVLWPEELEDVIEQLCHYKWLAEEMEKRGAK